MAKSGEHGEHSIVSLHILHLIIVVYWHQFSDRTLYQNGKVTTCVNQIP